MYRWSLLLPISYGMKPMRKTPINRLNAPVQPASRLQTSGSITRGILTGSNRDAAIESGLRLQVEGEVAPGVTVRAALTDEDTPLLPEGTTRRLDQFDRVFIQFESRRGLVQLGDYEARLDGSEFGQLRRKLQGGTIRTAPIGIDAGWIKDLSFEAGTAVSRGIFKSQAQDTEQGLQGPYRLTGNDGERFGSSATWDGASLCRWDIAGIRRFRRLHD